MKGFVFDYIIGYLPAELWEIVYDYYQIAYYKPIYLANRTILESTLEIPERLGKYGIHYQTSCHWWTFLQFRHLTPRSSRSVYRSQVYRPITHTYLLVDGITTYASAYRLLKTKKGGYRLGLFKEDPGIIFYGSVWEVKVLE